MKLPNYGKFSQKKEQLWALFCVSTYHPKRAAVPVTRARRNLAATGYLETSGKETNGRAICAPRRPDQREPEAEPCIPCGSVSSGRQDRCRRPGGANNGNSSSPRSGGWDLETCPQLQELGDVATGLSSPCPRRPSVPTGRKRGGKERGGQEGEKASFLEMSAIGYKAHVNKESHNQLVTQPASLSLLAVNRQPALHALGGGEPAH